MISVGGSLKRKSVEKTMIELKRVKNLYDLLKLPAYALSIVSIVLNVTMMNILGAVMSVVPIMLFVAIGYNIRLLANYSTYFN